MKEDIQKFIVENEKSKLSEIFQFFLDHPKNKEILIKEQFKGIQQTSELNKYDEKEVAIHLSHLDYLHQKSITAFELGMNF